MSLKRDNILLVTLANEAEGCTLTIKTTEALGKDKVLISAEDGVYKLEELKAAIKEIETFTKTELKQDDGSGYHLP